MEKTLADTTHVRTVTHSSFEELFITVPFEKGEAHADVFRKAAEIVRAGNATVVSQDVMGLPYCGGAGMAALRAAMGEPAWPVTWVEGRSGGAPLGGTQIWAVAGAPVEVVRLERRLVGCSFEDRWARYCRIGDIGPRFSRKAPEEQTRETLERMEAALEAGGMGFQHVIRTWFFNKDIHSWYSRFNKARNDFFREKGVFGGLVPASTGIGGGIPNGASLKGGLVAMAAKDRGARAAEVRSPLQRSPREYGSAFSRAVEAVTPSHHRLFVSGTASIASEGDTVHVDDAEAQIARAMEVVQALLASRGMSWSHVVRALAYFKRDEDVSAFERFCDREIGAPFPVLVMNTDICREELLFEIEVDAIRER